MKRFLLRRLFRASEILSGLQESRAPAIPPPSQILILTASTPGIREYAALAAQNKSRYAREHGYAFLERTEGFAASRPPAWSKILFIRQALREYPWVFWSDADALIMNPRIRLEEFMRPGKDVILAEAQAPYPHINTGQMLFRASSFSRLFLRAVWGLKVFTHDSTWEQRAVNHLAEHYAFRRLDRVSNKAFNAFAHVEGDPRPYAPGDFIVHFPGVKGKAALMRQYADLAT